MRSVALALPLLLVACGDPVHDSAVDALGPEAPGVRQGPLHRPGQPCVLCHDGSVGSPEGFSVAGTIYQRQGAPDPAPDVHVRLRDATGSIFVANTNTAGNFYVLSSEWSPIFPLSVVINVRGEADVVMQSTTKREPSCGVCHTEPASRTSPGHVALVAADGGVPP